MRAEGALRVELRPPAVALLHQLDRLNPRTCEREELLHAHAVAVAGYREVARERVAAVVDRKDLALEILHAELVAFLDLDRDADDVARAELGIVLLLEARRLLGVDLVNELDTHDSPP